VREFLTCLLVGLAWASAACARPAETVPQGGSRAEQLRKVLERIRLPEGFRIELFALVPDARQIAVGPKTHVLWIGTRKSTVWRVTRLDGGKGDPTVEAFRPDVNFDAPAGTCLSPDGDLFVAERNRVMMFKAADGSPTRDVAPVAVVGQGELIPPAEESANHSARACVVGPDRRIYLTLGQPYNVSPPEKLELYRKVGMGGIVRFKLDGTGREVVATGLRNSSGLDFNPRDGSLWFTDNQVDRMGDEIPPEELNRVPVEGGRLRVGYWYGYPWYGGGSTRTFEYRGLPIPPDLAANYVRPEVEMIAHAANLGVAFYTGAMFPNKYRGAIFNAQHGSWNATRPRGARVMVTFLYADGRAARSEPFAEGWLSDAGNYLGRPVDVRPYVDGSLLVSDDSAGAIYRIYYEAPR
jgi:glucose/arabinose dehydrogenase